MVVLLVFCLPAFPLQVERAEGQQLLARTGPSVSNRSHETQEVGKAFGLRFPASHVSQDVIKYLQSLPQAQADKVRPQRDGRGGEG
jgi:hypothetical protein